MGRLIPDVILNVRVDEPWLRPSDVELLVRAFEKFPSCDVATLATPCDGSETESEPKVAIGRDGFALAFSRRLNLGYRHIGVYAYSPRFLQWFVNQPQTPGEKREQLEQLRVLESGCRIRVAVIDLKWRRERETAASR